MVGAIARDLLQESWERLVRRRPLAACRLLPSLYLNVPLRTNLMTAIRICLICGFDVDGDGKLTINELGRAFRALGLKKRDGSDYEIDQEMFKSFDTNGDGKVTEDELKVKLTDATSYISNHVAIAAEGQPLQLDYTGYEMLKISLGQFVVFKYRTPDLAPVPDIIDVSMSVFFDSDPKQRARVVLEENAKREVVVALPRGLQFKVL